MSTRSRILSFMSKFSHQDQDGEQQSPTSAPAPPPLQTQQEKFKHESSQPNHARDSTAFPPFSAAPSDSPARAQREWAPARPMSMVQTYQPPLMDVTQDTLPELQPIFTFLNSHGNKLYQEGYFLKLDDQNTHGRANADRTWTECFAQLVGTVLSLWDAAELDAAGQEGEVLPKFINLTDASIKMIESLPTRSDNEAPLQNVLSISTAGKNRYLLHFNSHHSLIQWTAGIRLAMFEHATLQEAYTGALIAGKGKELNNIRIIMERSKFKTEDWARVRFGAGTPWRRCWCVITPPAEKEMQKLQKQMNKKKSTYDRARPPVLKGDIKFYDTKKTKKVRPIATINDAYSAFAIYPQSKPLIDASTLVKVEGSITIHSDPPTTTEGFVFVMPEVRPAVTGFEIMLRWLFPVFDTFALYGRPGRLAAETTDARSLMFAMPKHRRYGYLEILDVSGLILEEGSASWRESEWRRRMKDLTGKRMAAIENGSRQNSKYSRRSMRNSFGPSRSRINFDDGASVRSSPSVTWGQSASNDLQFAGVGRTESAPLGTGTFTSPRQSNHLRSVSETQGLDRYMEGGSSAYDGVYENAPPPPPPHQIGLATTREGSHLRYSADLATTPDRVSSEDEHGATNTPIRELQELQNVTSPEPVASPPAFSHAPGTLPISKPYQAPELRRANSRMSSTTLSQLAGAGGIATADATGQRPGTTESQNDHIDQFPEGNLQSGVLLDARTNESSANQSLLNEDSTIAPKSRSSFEQSTFSRLPNAIPNPSYSQQQQFPFTSPANLATNQQPNHITNYPSPSSIPNTEGISNHRTYNSPHALSSPDTAGAIRANQTAPGQGHAPHPSTGSTISTASQSSRPQSIARKPLPVRSTSMQTPVSATSTIGPIIDQAAFDLIRQQDQLRKRTPLPETQINRQDSTVSSIYDDTESTDSPDYASTRRSVDTRKSIDKPRAGVMRTVGTVKSEDTRRDDIRASIPDIDFGPTLNLAAAPRQRSPTRGPSPGPFQSYATGNRSGSQSPGPHVPLATGRDPTIGRPLSSAFSGSPSRKPVTPDGGHYRTESSESRTIPWQPGMSALAGSPGRQIGITPEQFVEQRASAATRPQYAHQRQPSTPPPPIRNRSGEFYSLGHSRNSSADLLQRPSSRGASVALGPSGSGDFASSLSAKEQEYLAKVTGQPLISMAQNNNRLSQAGLIAEIEAREKDKQQMKQGLNSQAVEHAIAQRQQQAQYQQYADSSVGGYRQSQYSGMPYSSPHFAGQPGTRQSWGMSHAPNVFAQGGGWSTPPLRVSSLPQDSQQEFFTPPMEQPQNMKL
ncbi:Histidine kinase [Chlorociboria aeruginascens]|nr:Histidine kinase [Chlorociboria aeruginascens]